ncbi:hypothetical protein LPB41_29245 [Thalassospira sp. MA62]|nr:hypothetical protein [Thalassospira sp. MA62]
MTEHQNQEISSVAAAKPGRKFCAQCGEALELDASHCPSCGLESPPLNGAGAKDTPPISDKSFGMAVSLCGVFGILGLHHFYLRNYVHGLIDLLLFVTAMVCLWHPNPQWGFLGVILLITDVGHTAWVMYSLFTGKTQDGDGKTVAYPGQFS